MSQIQSRKRQDSAGTVFILRGFRILVVCVCVVGAGVGDRKLPMAGIQWGVEDLTNIHSTALPDYPTLVYTSPNGSVSHPFCSNSLTN